eukprot:6233457-Pyramimonas_sp.AAC.1
MEMAKVPPAVYTFGQAVLDNFSLALQTQLRDRRIWSKVPLEIKRSLEAAGATRDGEAPPLRRQRSL